MATLRLLVQGVSRLSSDGSVAAALVTLRRHMDPGTLLCNLVWMRYGQLFKVADGSSVTCTCKHTYCYAIEGVGWGGVLLTSLVLANILDATQWMGWGGFFLTSPVLANILDATQWGSIDCKHT